MAPGLKALGYQQITSLAAAQTLTIPAGTQAALVTPETQSVRWRDDGTAPTATIGYPLSTSQELELDCAQMAAIKFIEQTASAKLNICYYGSPVGV